MKELICIVCPRGCHLHVDDENGYAVSGNSCPRGAAYGKTELINPTRTVTSTVRCENGLYPRCPVKTDRAVPKALLREAARALDGITVKAPIKLGQVILEDVCGSGASFIATRAMPAKAPA